MRSITYILAVMMLTVSPVFAASITIAWRSVRGSRGYVVEYRRADSSRTSRKRVAANRAVLNLPPATYRVRVAGLNKFGKPGIWSDWLKVSVASSSRGVVRLGASDAGTVKQKAPARKSLPVALMSRRPRTTPARTVPAAGAYVHAMAARAKRKKAEKPRKDAKKDKPRKDKPDREPNEFSSNNFWSFSTLIPGLPQMQRGDAGTGILYMGLAGALTGFVIARGAAADSIASQPGNNPLLMTFLLNGQSQQNLFIARELRADARAKYDARVQDQRLAAGLLTLVYIWHLVDTAFWKPEPLVSAARNDALRSYDVNVFADGERDEGRRAEFRFSMRF